VKRLWAVILSLIFIAACIVGCQTRDVEHSYTPEAQPRATEYRYVLLPEVDISGGYTQSLSGLELPFYLTSVLISYGSYTTAPGESFSVYLERAGYDRYTLLDYTATNAFSTLSWNVERMHGKVYLRRGDELIYNLSDTTEAELRACGRTD